jgi:dTDP-3-amino-3,4,6-trideoxy-alpha-D-glucose transaminase
MATSLSLKTDLCVPANDFRRQWQDLGPALTAAFEDFGESGWYVLGREVAAFEESLARMWGIGHAVGVASGLDALEISLRLLGCGPGDKVLTTPVSAFATTLAILKLGAVPVFADCDANGLLSLEACEELLERAPEIRYFVPVHLYGHSLDLDRLEELRNRFDLKMVEDCAQSIGARWHGSGSTRATGTVGQMAATSFYPTKNLGAFGDGGAILTSDPKLANGAHQLRDYGQSAKYRHEFIGYNSRLDELQATLLGRVLLPRLAGWIERRREIARMYLAGLSHNGITPFDPPANSESSWHLFPAAVAPERKAAFLAYMKSRGIAAGEHYPIAIPDQPAMATRVFEDHGCRTARQLCAAEVSLPIHPYLTNEEVQYAIDACNKWGR